MVRQAKTIKGPTTNIMRWDAREWRNATADVTRDRTWLYGTRWRQLMMSDLREIQDRVPSADSWRIHSSASVKDIYKQRNKLYNLTQLNNLNQLIHLLDLNYLISPLLCDQPPLTPPIPSAKPARRTCISHHWYSATLHYYLTTWCASLLYTSNIHSPTHHKTPHFPRPPWHTR